jgi:DNA-binding transcriptional ArsR family regulator
MDSFLISYLAEGLPFEIVRGLVTSARPRHLRELAREYGASPAGVSDILARLKMAGVLDERREGNRRLFSLRIGDEDRECLMGLFKVYELQRVRRRAHRANRRSAAMIAKLNDMDEMYTFYRKAKRR